MTDYPNPPSPNLKGDLSARAGDGGEFKQDEMREAVRFFEAGILIATIAIALIIVGLAILLK